MNTSFVSIRSKSSLVILIGLGLMSGCFSRDDSRLVGTWLGEPFSHEEGAVDIPASGLAPVAVNPLSHTEVRLVFFADHRFEMSRSTSGTDSGPIAGRWTVLTSAGDRQTVLLEDEETSQTVRLKVAFDQDGFVAREENGDSRIGAVKYRRSDKP